MSNEEPRKSPEKTEKLSQKGKCGAVVAKWQAATSAARSMIILKIGAPIYFIGLIAMFILSPETFGMYGLALSLVAGFAAFFPFLLDIYRSDKKTRRGWTSETEEKMVQMASRNPSLEGKLFDLYADIAKSEAEGSLMDRVIDRILPK